MCAFDSCDRVRAHAGSGLCASHRQQQRNGEPLRDIKRKTLKLGPCDVDGCDAQISSRNWCKTHYDQQLRGRPFSTPKPRVPVAMRNDQGNKRCSACMTWRPEADFASSNGKGDGLQSRCRPCNAAIYRDRALEVRDKMRKQRHNIDREAFDAMLAEQGNRCAICQTNTPGKFYWHVDHDHACCPDTRQTCGKCIRGILCSRCNTGIGQLRDDPALLDAAANYLRTAARKDAA